MTNEELIRNLIRGSIQRAVVESVAALIVLAAFGSILQQSVVGSATYYGCLVILVATGFVGGVVWSYALSYGLLRSHPATDTRFWREAFHAQARLLRLVPFWYCAPLGVGVLVFLTPMAAMAPAVYLMMGGVLLVIVAGVVWLNRRGAACIEKAALQLVD